MTRHSGAKESAYRPEVVASTSATVEALSIDDFALGVIAHASESLSGSYTAQPHVYLAIARALQSTPLTLKVTDTDGQTSIVLGRLRTESQKVRIGYLRLPLPSLRTFTVVYRGVSGTCDTGQLVSALDRWLRAEHRVQQIVFTKLEVDADLTRALMTRGRVTALRAEPHWMLELPDTFDQLLAKHSGKHRQRLRWERRKLEESVNNPLTHDVLGEVEEVETIVDTCEAIGQKTYHAKVGGMVRRDRVWQTMLATLAESKSLACHFFRAGSDPIAFVLTARHQGITHVIAMAHLPEHSHYSPGKHLLLEVLRDSCERGMRWVDYGFGDAQYKQVYGSHCLQELTLLLASPTPRATAVRCAMGMAASAHERLQYLVGGKIAGSIKQRWRGLAERRAAAKSGDIR